MKGWLVNDTLTCIPGTKTFWHDLLEWIPDLEYKVNGYCAFPTLAEFMENLAYKEGAPDYIIRNGTFFRPLNIKAKTISIIQDIYTEVQKKQQIEVANSSDVVIFNSPYTRSFYEDDVNVSSSVIPLGIDFDLFKPSNRRLKEILPNSILFVGAATSHPKGFDLLLKIIDSTEHNFCLVMKDNFHIDHPRIKVVNRVNHRELIKIYNSCSMLLCTSTQETQHLAGLEGAACGLPIVASNVGIYYNREDGAWGHRVERTVEAYRKAIDYILSGQKEYAPRDYFLRQGYSLDSCEDSWSTLVNSL